jgi:hypothetical protein
MIISKIGEEAKRILGYLIHHQIDNVGDILDAIESGKYLVDSYGKPYDWSKGEHKVNYCNKAMTRDEVREMARDFFNIRKKK